MSLIKNIFKIVLFALFAAWLITFLSLRFESHEYDELNPELHSAAAAYLDGKLTPVPGNWQWGTFEPEPGVALRTGMIDAPDAKGTVVVVPGFTASIEMLMREIVRIHAAGYRVASIEYRGQGESWRPLNNPEKGYVESFSQLGQELAQFAQQVRDPDKPLFFYSISKGGHITMRMAGEHKVDAFGYALIVPMIQVSAGDNDYSTMVNIASLMRAIGLGSLYAPGQTTWPTGKLEFGKPIPCNANPDTAQTREALFATRPSLRTNGVTMGWLAEAAASTEVLFSDQHQSAISQPVKIFTAGIDALVNTDAAQQFCDSLGQCEYEHFAEARHCITREDFTLYDGIVDSAIRHFDQQLQTGSPQ